jgi:hypothetical protein
LSSSSSSLEADEVVVGEVVDLRVVDVVDVVVVRRVVVVSSSSPPPELELGRHLLLLVQK